MTPKRFLVFLVVVILVVAGGGFAYYKMSRTTFTPANGSQELSQEQIASLVASVSKHMMLPTGEDPIVVPVAADIDIDTLVKTQPFYNGAQNGDVLLVYAKAGKAVLYSPSKDILINVGPIFVDKDAQTTTDQSAVDTATEAEVTTDETTTQ